MPAQLRCRLLIEFSAGSVPGTLAFVVTAVDDHGGSLASIHAGTAKVGASVHLGPLSIPLDLVAGDGPPPAPATTTVPMGGIAPVSPRRP